MMQVFSTETVDVENIYVTQPQPVTLEATQCFIYEADLEGADNGSFANY